MAFPPGLDLEPVALATIATLLGKGTTRAAGWYLCFNEAMEMMPQDKEFRYREMLDQVDAILSGEKDPIIWMATISSLLHNQMNFFWVGFYRVVGRELVIGPYQGTLGCLRIPFSRGVCGACATRRETILVPDVHSFNGHIACDPRSQSEIVVPVFDRMGSLHAVLDVDSDRPAAFDGIDQDYLELVASRMAGLKWTDPN